MPPNASKVNEKCVPKHSTGPAMLNILYRNSSLEDVLLVCLKRSTRLQPDWCLTIVAVGPTSQLHLRPTMVRWSGAILVILPHSLHDLILHARAWSRPRNGLASKLLSVLFNDFRSPFFLFQLCHVPYHRSGAFQTCCLTACSRYTSSEASEIYDCWRQI